MIVSSALLLVLVVAAPAVADEPPPRCDGACEAELDESLDVLIDWDDDDGSAEDGGSGSSPYTISFIVDFYLNQGCGPGRVMGVVRYVQVDPATGERTHLYDALECVPEPVWGEDGDPIPDDPVPTITTIRDAMSKLLPLPRVHLDPQVTGLTGLDTHVWHEPDPALEPMDHDGDPATAPVPGLRVSATAGPYTISARAWIVEYRWDLGDGPASRFTSTSPGTHEDPAATYLYETKGTRVVTATTVWAGTYNWSIGDVTSGEQDLGTVVRESSRDYQVIEVRSVIVG